MDGVALGLRERGLMADLEATPGVAVVFCFALFSTGVPGELFCLALVLGILGGVAVGIREKDVGLLTERKAKKGKTFRIFFLGSKQVEPVIHAVLLSLGRFELDHKLMWFF